MKSLNELRDELAYEHTANRCAKAGVPPFGPRTESIDSDFKAGFDAGTKAQAEVSSADVEFDEEAASDEGYKLNFINAVDSLQNVAFVRGARYQHQQNRAALSAMKGENEFLKTLIAQSNYRTENEIEKLRAENEKLKSELTNNRWAIENHDFRVSYDGLATKLESAHAQLELMANALESYSAGKHTPVATKALKQYKKWKTGNA